MNRNASMVSAMLGGLAVWGMALAGLASMPSGIDSEVLMTAIQDGPSDHVLAINERYVEMGLLDPSERDVEASAAPIIAPQPKGMAAYAAMDGGTSCPIRGGAQS